MLICFFDKLQHFLAEFDPGIFVSWQWKMGVHSLSSPAFTFVYFLVLTREEWVLLKLGSQHKRYDQAVWSMFPDLSVSCDLNNRAVRKIR